MLRPYAPGGATSDDNDDDDDDDEKDDDDDDDDDDDGDDDDDDDDDDCANGGLAWKTILLCHLCIYFTNCLSLSYLFKMSNTVSTYSDTAKLSFLANVITDTSI